jgi:glycosyltransferase involved in cell wall biosynthesis
VHVHSCGDAANIALLAKLLGPVDYSLTLHNALGASGCNQRQKWRHATFALVITHTLLREVRAELQGDLPSRIEVMPMGVDAEFFSRKSPYVPFDGSGEFRVFCCGRLNPGKGHRVLIEAIGALNRRGIPARLDIAGEDDDGGNGHRLELEAMIRDAGMAGQVRLLGAVSEEQVQESLSACHAFALASWQEALGVALMEAMAMQVPVVATRVGGVPELVADGSDGILVPPGDPHAMANALADLAHAPGSATRLGEAARKTIVARFSSRNSARLIAALVENST